MDPHAANATRVSFDYEDFAKPELTIAFDTVGKKK
jgi:hypothetical protein